MRPSVRGAPFGKGARVLLAKRLLNRQRQRRDLHESKAKLADHGRTENPRVGGSMPPLRMKSKEISIRNLMPRLPSQEVRPTPIRLFPWLPPLAEQLFAHCTSANVDPRVRGESKVGPPRRHPMCPGLAQSAAMPRFGCRAYAPSYGGAGPGLTTRSAGRLRHRQTDRREVRWAKLDEIYPFIQIRSDPLPRRQGVGASGAIRNTLKCGP